MGELFSLSLTGDYGALTIKWQTDRMGGKYKFVLATHYFFLGRLVDPLGLIKAFDERVAAEFFCVNGGLGISTTSSVWHGG